VNGENLVKVSLRNKNNNSETLSQIDRVGTERKLKGG
jgi:hypothetical protein